MIYKNIKSIEITMVLQIWNTAVWLEWRNNIPDLRILKVKS
jgi:hypothetical protein